MDPDEVSSLLNPPVSDAEVVKVGTDEYDI